MANLKTHTVTVGHITFVMMTYRTLLADAVRQELDTVYPTNDKGMFTTPGITYFALCDPVTVDATAEPGATIQEEMLVAYIDQRSGDTLRDVKLFQRWVSSDVLDAWFEAYDQAMGSAIQTLVPLPHEDEDENGERVSISEQNADPKG